MSMMTTPTVHGPQPLDRLMEEAGLTSAELVNGTGRNLTFKQIGKARRGKPLTRRLQRKIALAFSECTGTEYEMDDLFTYRGR